MINLLRPLLLFLFLAAAPVAGVFAAPTPALAPAALSPAPTPTVAAASPAATPAATVDPAAEVARAATADALWDYIKKWSDLSDLESIDPSLDPQARMNISRDLIHGKIVHLHPAIDEFLKRYPQDSRHWNAMLMRVLYLRGEEDISDESANNTLQQVAHAPDAPADVKKQARGALLQDTLEKIDPASGLSDALEKELSAYEKDFPDDPTCAQFVTLRLNLLQRQGAPEKINVMLAQEGKSPNKAAAEAAARQLDLRTKPLDLKLATLDGKEVDLAKLRGKVVLLDFWATWCEPCLEKVPEIAAIHKKYHDKDFQLVGVSLDENRHQLEETIKEKGIDWPQAFDPKGGAGDVPTRFGVETIPAAWLVDKKGMAHEVDVFGNLGAEIDRALAPEGGAAPEAAKKL